MKTQDITITVDLDNLPDGYEYIGITRPLRSLDDYSTFGGDSVMQAAIDAVRSWPTWRKRKPREWRLVEVKTFEEASARPGTSHRWCFQYGHLSAAFEYEDVDCWVKMMGQIT